MTMNEVKGCPSCAEAESNPRTGLFHIGCLECSARQLAHSPEFDKSTILRSFTDAYKQALKAIWGQHWTVGHAHVKTWAQRIDESR